MKKLLFVFIVVILVLVAYCIKFYIDNYEDLKEIDELTTTGKFMHKVFSSPSGDNMLTLMLHIQGGFNYTSHIYIIDGVYKANNIPVNDNYIQFPNSTGVYIEWESERVCKIIASREPEVNSFLPKSYALNLIVDRSIVDSLVKEGKVIRYSIEK